MKKEGMRYLFNSQEGKVNLLLLVSIALIFILSVLYVEAMQVTLGTPSHLTYNFSSFSKNVNFSFSSNWSFSGAAPALHENVSNCSLYINSTERSIKYDIVKNLSRDNMGADNNLTNSSLSLSHMNFTFTNDGNYSYTIGCYNFTNATATAQLTYGSNTTYFFLDSTPPLANFTNISDHFNLSATESKYIEFRVNDSSNGIGLNLTRNFTINLTIILGGSVLRYFTYLNDSSSNLTCNATAALSANATATAPVVCNATFNFNSNGTYLLNVTAADQGFLTNSSAIRVTVDQIPPVFFYFNTSEFLNVSYPTVIGQPLGTAPGSSSAQGKNISFFANWTDNMTTSNFTRVLQGRLEFHNASTGNWQALNYSPSNYRAYNNATWTNFTFPVPKEHSKEFEGKNISFRIVTNDTLGNINTTFTNNITILINDTMPPTINVTIGEGSNANFTNTSDTTPTVVWNIIEGNALNYVAIQIDGSTSDACFKRKNFSLANDGITVVEANRNGTVNVSSNIGCPLNNGTRVVRVTAEDIWGNSQLYIHSMTVNTPEGGPTINLTGLQNGLSDVNMSNVTPYTGINISAFSVGQGVIRNLSFISSCNSTVQTLSNFSWIWPFNYSTCRDSLTESNQTVTVTVFEFGGNNKTETFQFLVDNLGPSIAVHTPLPNQRTSNNVTLNISVRDGTVRTSAIGYFLDGSDTVTLLNQSNFPGLSQVGVNFTEFRNINFTPGKHTIKFTARDFLAPGTNTSTTILNNTVNSTLITFYVDGPINFQSLGLNGSSGTLAANLNATVSTTNLTNLTGQTILENKNTSDQTLKLFLALNATSRAITTNVSFIFNSSAANFDKYNFSVSTNNSPFRNGILLNQSVRIIDLVSFNLSVEEFLKDPDYYGFVDFVFNATSTDIGAQMRILYFENATNFKNPTNVTECSPTFAPANDNITTPCWNNSANHSIRVYVPHFSHILIANDTIPSTVEVNSPSSSGVQTVASFIPNITVSDDVKNCSFSYNTTGKGTNLTMIGMTIEEGTTVTTCYNTTEITNLTNATLVFNITFYVYDTSGNLNQTSFNFSVNDTTTHNISSISIGSISASAATVTVVANESINLSINSTGSNVLTGSNYANGSTYLKTQTLTISSLSASTTYNFTVKSCDRANNCLTNVTLGFTTSAAAATTTTTTTTSSSSGGGGGGAAPPSNEAATAARKWDSLEAGASAVLSVKSEQIGVTSIAIEVKNAVTNAEIKVASLVSNPYTAAAAAKVYQYLQLSKSNIADTDSSKITINFRVPTSWLTSNSVNENDVVLYRYSDAKWNALTTTKTGSDANNMLYSATTPGFSTFAIGGKEAAPEAPTAPTEEKPVEAPTAPAGEAPKEETKPAEEAKPGLSSTTMALIVILIVVALAAAGYYMMQKKKGQ